MSNASQGRSVGFLIVAGGLLLRAAENRLGIASGTLARYRAQVGECPSETLAWRRATDALLADAEARAATVSSRAPAAARRSPGDTQ